MTSDSENTRQPRRIQRKRTKGWRMPEGAVYVGRPTRWGNPYLVRKDASDPIWRWHVVLDETGDNFSPNLGTRNFANEFAVALYQDSVMCEYEGFPTPAQIQNDLHGLNLACWCPLDMPCHADVLLRIAVQ